MELNLEFLNKVVEITGGTAWSKGDKYRIYFSFPNNYHYEGDWYADFSSVTTWETKVYLTRGYHNKNSEEYKNKYIEEINERIEDALHEIGAYDNNTDTSQEFEDDANSGYENTIYDTEIIKSKEQLKINKKVHELLATKGDERIKYSKEDLILLSKYSGESEQKGIDKTVGSFWDYYTPDKITQLCWGLAYKYGFNPTNQTKVLEPSAGVGAFLRRYNTSYLSNVTAYELNSTTAQILKLLYPMITVENKGFEYHFYNQNYEPKTVYERFDLIIGNPPYRGSWSTITFQYKEKTRLKNISDNITTLEQYFIASGISALKKGGMLVYVVPNTLVDNQNSYVEFKKDINKVAKQLAMFRLPNGTFANTDVCTDIIILKKR